MAKRNRDDFTEKIKNEIAKRAGWLCSYPTCRAPTVGATSGGQGVINIGTAAHICAAAPGGPRYDPNMAPNVRASAANGIWMCRDHGKAIDSNDPQFTVELLSAWKKQAEEDSWRRVLRNEPSVAPAAPNDELRVRFRAATEADLAVFRRTAKWPSTSVALTLEVDGFTEPATTTALASAVISLEDLILLAPPGMGKTTTLFQIADSGLASGSAMPIVVPLSDWATGRLSILDSILKRPAFRQISESDFRTAATTPGVLLLLDGWNELDAFARERAQVEITTLKAELPQLAVVISTRKQGLDVPFNGRLVELLPLNDEQQMQIAQILRGETGERLLDQAWRTAGVRELTPIPLYLTALLSLPEEAPFPTTKEEVLRHFVAAHEKDIRSAEALRVVKGFQQDYLDGLAVFATQRARTAIADINARRSISETASLLMDNGQIATKPDPQDVLDILVNNHVLMRAGDTPGVSFQHQQFQEWYASHTVERQITADIWDPARREKLKADILNLPAWEESILFAVERMARGTAQQKAACGNVILAAFEVDPVLAAEMIFRSTDEVWAAIGETIQALVVGWHAPGQCDRALRFMLTSGRREFLDLVWPLITHENVQVSLKALGNCRRFRPSILGMDAVKRIRTLPQKVRRVLLREIASHSGMDGLDLATAIAREDPDPEVRATVADALAFRRADHHLVEVLQNASDDTFDLVVSHGHVDGAIDDSVRRGLAAARERQAREGGTDYERLRSIVHAQRRDDCNREVAAILSEMHIKERQDESTHLIYEAHKLYPKGVAEGVLTRVRAGKALFYGADDILAAAGFSLEDEMLLDLALVETSQHDRRAEAAASVLGPNAVGRMMDALFDVSRRLRDADGKFDSVASDRYHAIQGRIAHVPGASLVAAVCARSARADNQTMARLAELLSRHPHDETGGGRLFSADNLTVIRTLVEEWGNRMLAAGDAERWQLAEIATLASRAPDVSLLPLLKRLLDENLRRYRAFREEASAHGWRQGKALDEARRPMMHEYQRAFLAIDAPQTAALMCEYLSDEHFGELAAWVLARRWIAANESSADKPLFGRVDFRRVKERRDARAANPAATSEEAEAIFAAIEPLIVEGATENQKRLAIALGIVAARLPHAGREATIETLIRLAPRRSRAPLLLSLVLSGTEISSKLVADGINETFEAAKKDAWILTQSDAYELREWLRLLPFVDRLADALAIVRGMPEAQRKPDLLEEMVGAFRHSFAEGVEEILFKLAEDNPYFYQNHQWRATVLKIETASATRRLINLTANGVFDGKHFDGWHWARELGDLIAQFAEMRRYVYELLKHGPTTPGLVLLAQAIAEYPDVDGLLLLISFEVRKERSFWSFLTVEKVVTEHVPDANWKGAYQIFPVPAVELRQKLLMMTTDGTRADAAARCLRLIDAIRDDYGIPPSEPRHPDLASGKPWPIMVHDPDATAE